MKISEKQFENKIKRILKEKGAWVLKTWGGGFQRSGIPDLLICYKGRFIAIEVKAEEGRLSELQIHELMKISESGGSSLVLRPSNLKDLYTVLEAIEEKK